MPQENARDQDDRPGASRPGKPAMTGRKWLLMLAGVAVALVAVVVVRNMWRSDAGLQNGPRIVPVEAIAAVTEDVPVRVVALGTVTPMASVAVKARLDSVITEVHFQDGARVKAGDVLFSLDDRQLVAEIKRVEAVIVGAQAQFEQARRDVERYSELVAKNATTVVTLNNAQTQVNIFGAAMESNRATLENLKVQLGYATIRAPISGRISAANVKVGNFVRSADATPLATIIQIAPVYVSFPVPQRVLPELRQALAQEKTQESATVEAIVPGDARRASGRVSMIENIVDAATGTVIVRATMDNKDELLWPGTLVNVRVTLRMEKAVVLPSTAIQVGQEGSFVFVVEDGVARVRPIEVARTLDERTVIGRGLNGGETVVTDGQLLLVDGTQVTLRKPAAGVAAGS
jgi:multidrug efflux system membrane fusion protein